MKNNGDMIKFLKSKDYIMIDNDLGSGSFGKTVLLQDPFIDELFVAKKYEPYLEEDKKKFFDSFLQEIKIMYKLFHPNIVRIFNYYPFKSSYTGYIIMEYINGKNIAQYLNEYIGYEEVGTPDDLFVQLIDGFDYLERKGIVHRDIREGNILVTSEGIVKIIDFGLGKTFAPVDLNDDSMNGIINRSGLDCLPNEYYEGTYDSRTDMFYLAELFNRLLINSNNDMFFSYKSVLEKMMNPNKENRYNSFNEIKVAISLKDFGNFDIKEEDKKIYQNFSNAIMECLSCYTEDKKYVDSVDEFKDNLHELIQKNCFEDIIQNTSDIVSTIVKSAYRYYPSKKIPCEIIKDFERWFITLSNDTQRLVLNNIIAKMSTKKVILEYDLPF